jgi:hypothetical protein
MTRWKAASIHLAISAFIALGVVATMLFVWYPPPYFEAMGGDHLVAILIGVDVVLGPLITLIIFAKGKALRLIRLDLTVIGLVQLAALVYGVSVVAGARPVYLAFSVDRFDVTSANEILPEELAKVKRPEYKSIPLFGPKLVATRMPDNDPDEQYRVLVSGMSGADINTFPQHFLPYPEMALVALKRAKPVEKLREYNPGGVKPLEDTLARLGRTPDSVRFLPLKARARDMSVLIDATSGEFLAIVPVSPWM